MLDDRITRLIERCACSVTITVSYYVIYHYDLDKALDEAMKVLDADS